MGKYHIGLFIFVAFLAVLDGVATFYGTYLILGSSTMSTLFSAVFALIIGAILISTVQIFKHWKKDFLTKLTVVVWFLAFAYDFYTSYVGNSRLLGYANDEKTLLIVTITFLITASTIVISYMINANNE